MRSPPARSSPISRSAIPAIPASPPRSRSRASTGQCRPRSRRSLRTADGSRNEGAHFLGLADLNGQIVTDGEFAKALLTALEASGGKAVNRSELLTERDPGVLTWAPWHLEPSWLVVVAAALCHAGKLELGYPGWTGRRARARSADEDVARELVQLTHVAPPKALPIVALRDAAALLDIAPVPSPTLVRPNRRATDSGQDADLPESRARCRAAGERRRAGLGSTRDRPPAGPPCATRGSAQGPRESQGPRLGGKDEQAGDRVRRELEAANRGKQELERTEGIVKARNHLSALQYVADAQAAFDQADPFVG